ncbi:GtrA-like protein [compost metagenome]
MGASLGYVGNRQWAFRHSGSVWRSSLKYAAFHAGGYVLNYLMLYIFVDELGFPHQLVQAAAIVAVAGYLFVAFNLFVFKAGSSEGTSK